MCGGDQSTFIGTELTEKKHLQDTFETYQPPDLYSLALRTQPFELQTLTPLTRLSLSSFSLLASPPTQFVGSTTPCPAPHPKPIRVHTHTQLATT